MIAKLKVVLGMTEKKPEWNWL